MATVVSYERPTTLEAALAALARERSVPVGGGTKVNATESTEPIAVVDLQALGLGGCQQLAAGRLRVGATTTLQELADSPEVPRLVREAARREEPSTLRTLATVGGCVATADFESELLAALLCHDAEVWLATSGGRRELPIPELWALRQDLPPHVITAVSFETGGRGAAARVGRTCADRPIVVAVARRSPAGVVRVALAGVAATPALFEDGGDLDPPSDFRGSAEYRRAIAPVLVGRVLEALG
jgi:CO/xanthine dehydrogenase FAD-binding subunit